MRLRNLRWVDWRQWRYWSREVRSLFNRVRSTRRAKRHPERVEAYLARCRGLVERAVDTLDTLRAAGRRCPHLWLYRRLGGARPAADRPGGAASSAGGDDSARREGLFDFRGSHALGFAKGKAGTPVELGVPVALIEDQYQFVLHHEVLWQGSDVDVAVPLVQAAQARYPGLRACSFDRGFHRPGQSGRAGRAARPERVAEEGTSFERRPAGGRKRNRSSPRAEYTRRLSRPSTGWSIGVWTVSATMAPTASRVRSPCRCWPPTCIASGCCCRNVSAHAAAASPDWGRPGLLWQSLSRRPTARSCRRQGRAFRANCPAFAFPRPVQNRRRDPFDTANHVMSEAPRSEISAREGVLWLTLSTARSTRPTFCRDGDARARLARLAASNPTAAQLQGQLGGREIRLLTEIKRGPTWGPETRIHREDRATAAEPRGSELAAIGVPDGCTTSL